MSIPNYAKKVFTGEIFDVYQWDQKMYDGSTAIFEALKRPDTLQVLPIIGDKIVLIEEEQPTYPLSTTIIAGRLKEGETTLEGMKRELLEEVGLASDDWELFRTYQPSHKVIWTIHTFIARDCKKIQEPRLDPGEKITRKDATFEEFLDIMMHPTFLGRELAFDLMRMRIKEPEKLEEFRGLLFKK